MEMCDFRDQRQGLLIFTYVDACVLPEVETQSWFETATSQFYTEERLPGVEGCYTEVDKSLMVRNQEPEAQVSLCSLLIRPLNFYNRRITTLKTIQFNFFL